MNAWDSQEHEQLTVGDLALYLLVVGDAPAGELPLILRPREELPIQAMAFLSSDISQHH